MMKRIVIAIGLVCCGLIFNSIKAQTAGWQWAQRAGGAGTSGSGGADDEAVDIAVDNEGNTYVCGTIYDSFFASFDTMKVKTYGEQDLFIAKYNCDGILQWLKVGGNRQKQDIAVGIAVDTLRDFVYFTGSLRSTNIDVFKLSNDTTITTDHSDYFLIQFDTNGNLNWMFVGNSTSRSNGISLDSNGNIYTVFNVFTPTQGAFAPGYNLTPGYYLGKFDQFGNLLWVDSLWDSGDVKFNDLATDKAGFSYITGYFKDTAEIFGQQLIAASGAFQNMFLAKYDSNGSLKWVRRSEGYYENGEAVDVDENGNCYVTGSIGRDAIFESDTLNPTGVSSAGVPFIVKYTSNGNYQWGRYAISPFPSSSAYGITINPVNNHPIISGEVKGVMSFEGMAIGTSGVQNGFFVEYDEAGNGIRAQALPASGIDMNFALTVAAGYNGNVYLAGSFGSDIQLPEDTIYSAGGNSDIFVAKYGIPICADTTTDDTTGIADIAQRNYLPLLIYPNPSTGSFTIEAETPVMNGVLSIYSATGQLVFEERFSQTTPPYRKSFDTNLKTGVYFMRLQSGDSTYYQKLIIRQ